MISVGRRPRRAARRPLAGPGAVAGLLAAIASHAAGGPAYACDPVRVATTPESLPEAWRGALADMVAATRRPGTPWSCSAGAITVTVGPSGSATLRLEESGRPAVDRPIAAPAELVPTAEALLAVPAPPPPAAPPPRTTAPAPRAAPPPSTPAPPPPPRLLIDTLFALRYATPSPGPWLGGELRGSLLFGAWSIGLGARYDMLLAFARNDSMHDTMSEVAVGLSAGRRLITTPIELYVTLDPRIAVVVFEAQTTTDRTAGARVDGRIGTGLRAAHRITDSARWVVAIDAELTPSALAGEHHADDPTHALPAFGMGLGVGLEAAIP